MRHACLALGLTLVTLLAAPPAQAWGPSVHMRECLAVADRLTQQQHPLAKLVAAHEPALLFGCIAPDFRQTSKALAAIDTHSWQLGRHLLQAAQQPGAPDGAVAFAIGHLAHHASDGVESWYATRLTALAPLGGLDVLAGVSDHGFGECELWVEVLGEMANGRTDRLVGLLQAVGVFEAESTLDWPPLVTWWVQQANAFHGKPVASPAQAVQEMQVVLAKAKASVGGFDPAGLADLLAAMATQPPAANVQLLSALPLGDALAAFGLTAGAKLDPVRWRPVRGRPFFADLDLWHAEYAAMADLAPSWTLDLVAGPKLDPDWPPSHDGLLMQAGTRQSLAHAMPAGTLAAEATVTLDEARWLDAQGQELTAWQPGQGAVTLQVRVFALQPVATTVVLRVHAIGPGLEPVALGAQVTLTTALLALDPQTCVAKACRVTLQATVDPGPWAMQTRALVLALARVDNGQDPAKVLPFVHGDWRRYQAHAALEVFGPVYDPWAHGEAGWPPSLRLPGPPPAPTGSLLVRVREAPAGNAVPGRAVQVLDLQGKVVAERQGNAGGRAAVDGLPPGAWRVRILGDGVAGKGADGLPIPAEVTVAVLAGEATTVVAPVWLVPALVSATVGEVAEGTVLLHLELAPLAWLGDQPVRLEWRAGTQPGGNDLWPPPGASPLRPLPDGAALADRAGRTHLLAVPAGAMAGLRRVGAMLHVSVRLVFGDVVEPAEAVRGPWARLAVSLAVPVVEPAPDASEPTADAAPSTAADLNPVKDAQGQAPGRPADDGCQAGRTGRSGAGLALAIAVYFGTWAWRRRRIGAAALTLLACTLVAPSAVSAEDPPEHGFVVGEYVLVGRQPDGGKAYTGRARIVAHGKGLALTREIGRRTTVVHGALEISGETKVLRFRWQAGKKYELMCQIHGDLDNYARLTCLWGRAGNPHRQPGVEAYFSSAGWEPDKTKGR